MSSCSRMEHINFNYGFCGFGLASSPRSGGWHGLRRAFLTLGLAAAIGFSPAVLLAQQPPADASSSAAAAPDSSTPGGPAAAQPIPEPPENHSASDSYLLRDNDLIRITVFQEDDLTTETRISKSGSITFPLLGAVQLSGKSVAEAISDIRTRLDKDYIINPQVTLTVLEYAEQWVTVLGEVQKPGQVVLPAEGGLDLLGAIALAGGYTRVADPANVIVRRVVDGKDIVLRVNAKRLARDTKVQQFVVEPGDRISVSESIW
jgi:polysaccharide export outer membrane protein